MLNDSSRRLAALLIIAFAISLDSVAVGETMRFYLGTYTTRLGHVDGRATGIGIYEIDGDTGAITKTGQSPDITNSSHMCVAADGRQLYVGCEVVEFDGKRDGYLTVFNVDPPTGGLTKAERARVSSNGPGPAYVRLDRSGKHLLLANYVAGNIVVYRIDDDGMLGQPTATVAHEGSSVNRGRQEGPHPHAIVPSPDNRFIYVPDLGIDRIVAYRFDAKTGELAPAPTCDAVTPPGSGPRHLVFSEYDGVTYAFCSLELSSELAVYRSDEGRLVEVARASTLPAEFTGVSTTAEVRVSSDGRHVYVSNRGHDSIALLEFDAANETVTLIETVSTAGKTPRNFGLSPDGEWVVAGNQDSHTLVAFKRDAKTGRLHQVGEPLDAASPALVYFVE